MENHSHRFSIDNKFEVIIYVDQIHSVCQVIEVPITGMKTFLAGATGGSIRRGIYIN